MQTLAELNANFAIEEILRFELHESGLIVGNVSYPDGHASNRRSEGQFFVHGAHVTHFRPSHASEPVLFMSSESLFTDDKAIRGGIPICFPWFGPSANPGEPAHGLARLKDWHVSSTSATDDAVTIVLELALPPFQLRFQIRFGRGLIAELTATNTAGHEVTHEVALHTYFAVGDIHAVSVDGDLPGLPFLDQLTGDVHAASHEAIRFSEETDRIYSGIAQSIQIDDGSWKRKIRITPSGSHSTVVWNPWIAKSQRMSDFGDHEYLGMLCIETANVKDQRIALSPNGKSTVSVAIDLLES